MKPIYTIPKVAKPADPLKPWFVWFRYNGKIKRFKFGINYIKDLKKRAVEADAICAALLQKLKKGWNPDVPDDIVKRSEHVQFRLEVEADAPSCRLP